MINQLNFHHLRYFQAIVHHGGLTAAARHLNVAQSSISVQLKELEKSLGVDLFDRRQKSLHLTETGLLVLDYANSIFRTGEEMMATLQNRSPHFRKKIHVGSVATLSRNFQIQFLHDLILNPEVGVTLYSSGLEDLLDRLTKHQIDIVLTNQPVVYTEHGSVCQNHLIDEQTISLFGQRSSMGKKKPFRFPQDLADRAIILPTRGNELRNRFDQIMESTGTRLLIAAEADDMAMLRLLAREMDAWALLPAVVVRDEIESGVLREICRIPDLTERFFAVTCPRKYPHPHVKELLQQKAPAKQPTKPPTKSGPKRGRGNRP